jgi:hypothetical protein
MKNLKDKIKMQFRHELIYNPNTFMRCWEGLDLGSLVLSTVWYDIVYKKQKAMIDNQVVMPFLLTKQRIKLKL